MTISDTESDDADGRGASVLLNAIAVLRSFSLSEPELGVSEIARRVGMHKSSVSRILATLEQQDLVERDPASRRFRLGLGVISLAGPLLADLDVRRAAHPALQELSERTGETSALMLWNGSESVCVEQVPSRHPVKHSTALGTRYDDALSASVKVFLADAEPAEASALLNHGAIAGLVGDVDAYLSRIHEAATGRGYQVNYGETSTEEVGVSAPVCDHRGAVVGAILISAPRFRVAEQDVAALGTACMDAARAVTARLGGARGAD